MLVRIFTTSKEISKFRCLFGRQACLVTNRVALHPEADVMVRNHVIPANAGIYTLFCGKEAH